MIFFTLCTLNILLLSKSFAQTELANVIFPKNRIITITGHPDYPPVVWKKKNGKELQGIAVELLERILKEADIKAVFTNVETWGRAQKEVTDGRIDMLIPPYKTSERLKHFNYEGDTFMLDETVVFVKKGMEFKFDDLNDLLKYPGVAIINDSFGTKFDKFDKTNKNITRLPTTEQCFRFTEKNRARYVIAGLNPGKAALATLMLDDEYTYLPKRIIITGLYAPISNKSQWNIPIFNNYLKRKFVEYEKKGIIRSLEIKYLAVIKKEKQEQKLSIKKNTKR